MKIIIKYVLLSLCILPLFILADASVEVGNTPLHNSKVTLTVAIEEIGYFPYGFEDNDKIKGFTIELLDFIEANSKYNFQFIVLPWPRILHLVEQGKVDLILTLFKNEKREKKYHYIEPAYGYEINQLFTLKGSNVEFDGRLQQLKPFTIGTKREFSYGKPFDQASYLNKLPAINEEVLLKLLLSKRIDIAISNPYIFKQLILEKKVSAKIEAIEPYVEKTPVYLGLTKNRDDSQEIKETLGQLTMQFKTSTDYKKLLNKYRLNFK